jgi:hypothetical protein
MYDGAICNPNRAYSGITPPKDVGMSSLASSSVDRRGRRVLVLIVAECDGESVFAELTRHEHPHAEIKIVAPIVGSRLEYYIFGDDHKSRPEAQLRLRGVLTAFERHGTHVTGELGDMNPLQTIEDEIVVFAPDELLIVVHPDNEQHWFERHLPEDAQARFGLPTTILHSTPVPAAA